MKNIVIRLNKFRILLLVIIVVSALGYKDDCEDTDIVTTKEKSPNILLILADDMGKDATNGFTR